MPFCRKYNILACCSGFSTEGSLAAGGVFTSTPRKNSGKAIDFSHFFDSFTPPLIGI
jgi:hypothetical protein